MLLPILHALVACSPSGPPDLALRQFPPLDRPTPTPGTGDTAGATGDSAETTADSAATSDPPLHEVVPTGGECHAGIFSAGTPRDLDGDGFANDLECGPFDDWIHPGARRQCWIDADCSGQIPLCASSYASYRVVSSNPSWTEVQVAGDVDADGRDDLLLVASGAPITRGAAAAWFVPGGGLAHGDNPVESGGVALLAGSDGVRVAAAGDVDGDGAADLLVVDPNRGAVGFLGAGGLGSCEVSTEVVTDWVAVLTADAVLGGTHGAGDVDGDGRGDVVLSDADADAGRVVLVSGSALVAGLGDLLTITVGAGGAVRGGPGDVDGDGLDDLVITDTADCGVAGGGCVRLFRADGLGGGGERTTGDADHDFVPEGAGGLTGEIGGDLDGDGLADIVAVGRLGEVGAQTTTVYILPDDGSDGLSSVYEAPASIDLGGYPGASVAARADLDGDGATDLVFSNEDAHRLRVTLTFGPDFLSWDRIYGDDPTFGSNVPAERADIDGDGFDDVVVGPSTDTVASIFLTQHP